MWNMAVCYHGYCPLIKHTTVSNDYPGYITRYKAASANIFSKHVDDQKSIEILKMATALGPRYKNMKCLSDDAKEQTLSLIGQQIASDYWWKTKAQDDTDSVNKTI